MIAKTLARIAAGESWIPWTTCLGLLIFFSFFVCILVWTARRQNRVLYHAMSRLPLEDEVQP